MGANLMKDLIETFVIIKDLNQDLFDSSVNTGFVKINTVFNKMLTNFKLVNSNKTSWSLSLSESLTNLIKLYNRHLILFNYSKPSPKLLFKTSITIFIHS